MRYQLQFYLFFIFELFFKKLKKTLIDKINSVMISNSALVDTNCTRVYLKLCKYVIFRNVIHIFSPRNMPTIEHLNNVPKVVLA